MSECISNYLYSALDPTLSAVAIKTAMRLIREWEQEGLTFDTIAFRGMSGALMAPRIADQLGKRLLLSRKEKDCSHSSYKLEGNVPNRYIILDDLICSGNTIIDTISAITEWRPSTTCAGVVLYHSCERDTFVTASGAIRVPVRTFHVSGVAKELDYYRGKQLK